MDEVRGNNKHYFETQDRRRTTEILKRLYEKGYRYVTRDLDSEFLTCFNLKPKRYMNEMFWGYKESDLNSNAAKMAEPIKNIDVKEIKWTQRSATPIKDFIEENTK